MDYPVHAILQARILEWLPFSSLQVALVVKNPPASVGDARDVVQSLVGKIPWRRAWELTPILARRMPWTEESGRLQSMGLQRVGHDSATNTHTHTHTHTHT